MGLGVFQYWNRKVTSPKWGRIILRSFPAILPTILIIKMAYNLLNIYNTQKVVFSVFFSGIFFRKSVLFGLLLIGSMGFVCIIRFQFTPHDGSTPIVGGAIVTPPVAITAAATMMVSLVSDYRSLHPFRRSRCEKTGEELIGDPSDLCMNVEIREIRIWILKLSVRGFGCLSTYYKCILPTRFSATTAQNACICLKLVG